jgi:predicted nucleic acid-binding Zn ribbon protein
MDSGDDDFDEVNDSDSDTSDSDDDCTSPCPHCGELIYDDAERCPECGQYVSREDAPTSRKPLWILIGLVVCALVVVAWLLTGF